MDDLRATVGASLKRLRQGRGLTQAELAEAIGRSVDMVSRLERGDATPSLETLALLAGALAAHPAELLGGKSPKVSETSPETDRLLQRVATSSTGDIKWVLDLLDHMDRRPAR